MQEIVEFRLNEQFAEELFSPDEGKRIGKSIRKIKINTKDSIFYEIGKKQLIHNKLKLEPFFYGWAIKRYYSKNEICNASLFRMIVTSVTPIRTESCEASYDYSFSCPICRSGPFQNSPISFDTNALSKNRHIYRTISGEIFVSSQFVSTFLKNKITGINFRDIDVCAKKSNADSWFQMIVSLADIDIVSPTRIGNDPFDEDTSGKYRCPNGDLIGLNVLSEISISRRQIWDHDVMHTRQFIGVHRGLLRPERLILVSPKTRAVIESAKFKGVDFEIVRLV